MAQAKVTDFLDSIEDFDEQIPDEVFAAGELELEVQSISFQVSDGDDSYPRFLVVLALVDNEDAELVYYTLWLPTKDDDKRQKNRRQRIIRDFVSAFGYNWPMDLVDFTDDNFKGRTAFAIVGNQENRKSGDREHVVKAWVAPS